jgi:predicted DNA-binding protein with PD1-like motif
MRQFNDPKTSIIVLEKGEELLDCLNEMAVSHDLKGAWLNGLGGAAEVTIGFRDPIAKKYDWQDYNEPLEILSLQGNLAWVDGQPFWHIHGVFSGSNNQAIGGHVKRLLVGLTCELLITAMPASLTRVVDDETGLKLLVVRER